MVSRRQITANRRNAARSTGPRTDKGKQRSRQNAVQHGLSAETVVTILEDADRYEALIQALMRDYRPETEIEQQLIARLASLLWRLRRATLIETGLFQIQGEIVCERSRGNSSDASIGRLSIFYKMLDYTAQRPDTNISGSEYSLHRIGDEHKDSDQSASKKAATIFLRLCNLNNDSIQRLGR